MLSKERGTAMHEAALAVLLRTLGEYEEARALFERCLPAQERILGPEHPETVASLSELAVLMGSMGEFAEARSLLERTVAINEKIGGHEYPETARSLDLLAGVLTSSGEREQARQLHERALEIREAALGKEHPDVATSLEHLAALFAAEGNAAAARPLVERAIGIREKTVGPEHPATATALVGLADVVSAEGDPAAARPLLERAVAIRERKLGAGHPDTGKALETLAELYADLGEEALALDAALRADDIGVKHLARMSRTLSERAALRYAAVRPRGLDVALTLMAAQPEELSQDAGRVWEAEARSRGLVLETVSARHRKAMHVVRLAQEFRQASEQASALVVRSAPAAEIGAAERRREEAERALARAAGSGAETSGELTVDAMRRALPLEWVLVGYARFERHEGRERVPSYLAFVMRKGDAAPSIVPLGPALAIEKAVQAWSRELNQEALAAGRSSERGLAAYRAAGEALRRLVWDPIARRLDGSKVVLVVPDGALHTVNLAALPTGESTYLVESELRIHYLSAEHDLGMRARPSGSGLIALGSPDFEAAEMFAALRKGEATTDDAAEASTVALFRGERAACGVFRDLRFDALPGSAREVEEIARLWREREAPDDAGRPAEAVEALTGAGATETAFKEQAPGKRVLHVATHGFFLGGACSAGAGQRGIGGLAPAGGPSIAAPVAPASPSWSRDLPWAVGENPLRLSGLAFAGANHREHARADEDDGVLTAEEIAVLDLTGVEWAVLSACDTGVGEIQAGEGVFGLRRAFQVAGAGTLILSLWSVDDDSTREWMEALYRARLNQRAATTDAVRQASLSVLEARRGSARSVHPFYWAGFVAAGDWQ